MGSGNTYVHARRDAAMVVFIAAVFVLAVVYSVFSATTIGDNINTAGSLTVSSAVSASSTVHATGEGIFFGRLSSGKSTSTAGTNFAVHGDTLLGGPVSIYGPLALPYLQATTTTASYFTGALGLGTTTPGNLLAVHGPALFNGTTTHIGGIIVQNINATGTLSLSTGSAVRMTVDSSGNIGIASVTPANLFSVGGLAIYGTAGATSTNIGNQMVKQNLTIYGALDIRGGCQGCGVILNSGTVNRVAYYSAASQFDSANFLAVDTTGGFLGIATGTPGTPLAVTGAGVITEVLTLRNLIATGTQPSYFTGALGIGTTTPGTALSVHNGRGVIGPLTLEGPLSLPYLQATSTTASYFVGALGVGTTTPGALFSVHGPALFSGTTTHLGGIITQNVNATGTLSLSTGSAVRVTVDSSGNVGVASKTPSTTFDVTGSAYLSTGLGVGTATTGAGHVHATGMGIIEGRLAAAATTSPYQEVGFGGDVAISSNATTTVSAESTIATASGCIELKDSAGGRWIRIYPGNQTSTTSLSATIVSGGAGLLVIETGRCQ